MTSEATVVSWRERLWPAPWLVPVVLLVGTGFGLVAAPFGGLVVVSVAVLMTLVLGGLLLASTPTVAVADGEFAAGRARIPVRLLGEPEILDAAGMRRACGPELDARAFRCLRDWIHGGVRVPVLDPHDPAPYWLVSSRRPAELAGALRRARP